VTARSPARVPGLRILFFVVFVELIGFGVIIPLLPFYGEHFQATPAMVGLLMASYSLAQFVTAPLWGRLSDRIGRRPVLMASLAGTAASYLALAFADHLWLLFAARIFGGGMAGGIAAAFAYAADVSTPANRARAMGVVGAAFGIGFIFGPAIGGILAGSDPATADFRSPALAAGALSLTACLLTVVLLPESLPAERRVPRHASLGRRQALRQALGQPLLVRLIGLMFLATFVFAGMETTFAMWSRRQFGWGPEQNGYLFALVGLIGALVQGGLVGRLAKSFGEIRLVAAGAALLAVGMLAIPFSQSLWLLVPAISAATLGFSLLTPSLNSLVSLQVDSGRQGGTMGIARSATTLARVLGPTFAGAVFQGFGKSAPFVCGAAIMLAVLLLALQTARTDPPAH
jgi:DHA1 family tetracycline resistance protein-like MFS transporter